MMKYILIIASLFLSAPFSSHAVLKIPPVFASKMILQRRQPIPVWGQSDAHGHITVTVDKQSRSVRADASGSWRIALPPMEAGGPYTMVIADDNKEYVILRDVLIGEVWVCAGQSNMNFILAADHGKTPVYDNDSIREFRCLMPAGALNPENSEHSEWINASSPRAGNFSAVAYYFAHTLWKSLHVPVGIILMSCGDTRSESWTDPAMLRLIAPTTTAMPAGAIPLNHQPGVFFTETVCPIAPFGAKGLVWYQGESNTLPDDSGRPIAERADEYKALLRLLIQSFRHTWEKIDWPVLLVQLPNYKDPSGDIQWARIRQSQLEISREVPHTSLTVTIDLGDSTNIHPNNKGPVGTRLANQALHDLYGRRFPREICGPLVKNAMARGDSIIITFYHAGKGLIWHTPGTTPASGTGKTSGCGLQGFEVANAADPERFTTAAAHISDHQSGHQVIVRSAAAAHPRCIRYAWSDNPAAGLFNTDGLPASPFLIAVEKDRVPFIITGQYGRQTHHRHRKYEGRGCIEHAPPADGYFHQRRAAAPVTKPLVRAGLVTWTDY